MNTKITRTYRRLLISALVLVPFLADAQSRRVGDMLELPAYSKGTPEQVIFHTGYTVSYNSSHRIPNWSAWMLTKAHTQGEEERGGVEAFVKDPQVKGICPEGRDYQYKTYQYDRGHMCPAMDSKWSAKVMEECFYMSNMCPQKHELNGGTWKSLEEDCQKWARKYGKVYICCGPVLAKGEKLSKIGTDKRITAPSRFFKVILRYDEKGKSAIGYVFEQSGKYRIMSVDDVEAITGLDFFHNLPDAEERRIEASFDSTYWGAATKNVTSKKSSSKKKSSKKQKTDYDKAQETIQFITDIVDIILK